MGKIVSVLIPTRNRQELAIKAIRSALAQTYDHLEIIVTDNSDTDQLSGMIDLLDDGRVRYSKNSKNIGPILNWRNALEIARGEYCLIIPDDDYLINPFYIEDAVKILENKKINIVITDCVYGFPEKNSIGASGFSGFIYGYEFIRNGHHIPHIGNVFRRDLALDLNAFHSNEILWSDIELWMRMMSAGDVYCYNFPSVFYLFHSQNIVLNMSKPELMSNSSYIRDSVKSLSDEALVSELVCRYLYTVDYITNLVDYQFIKAVFKINKIEKNVLNILIRIRLIRFRRRLMAFGLRIISMVQTR